MERTTRVKDILGLRRLPIKVGFLDALPPALARWSGGPVAAGCVFWDRAMEGKSFYTLPADHWNCAIGSHTHKISLPADRANELGDTISFMVETRYLDAAEVPDIPTLDRAPAAVAYAPATSNAVNAILSQSLRVALCRRRIVIPWLAFSGIPTPCMHQLI